MIHVSIRIEEYAPYHNDTNWKLNTLLQTIQSETLRWHVMAQNNIIARPGLQ